MSIQKDEENIIICISFHHFYFWEELFCRSFSVSDNSSHFGICSWRSHRSLFGKCHLVFIAYLKKFSIHNGEIPFRRPVNLHPLFFFWKPGSVCDLEKKIGHPAFLKKQGAKNQGHCCSKREEAAWSLLFLNKKQGPWYFKSSRP